MRSFLFAIALFIISLSTQEAFSQVGVIRGAFDPILQSQIDEAQRALRDGRVTKVIFAIETHGGERATYAERQALLQMAVPKSPAITVLDASDLKATLKSAHSGERVRDLATKKRTELWTEQTKRVHHDAALSEALLPEPVAKDVRRRRLYDHSGLRGFYALPRHIIDLVNFEQTLNDKVENTDVFSSIHSNNLPKEYRPENRPTFAIYHVDVPISELTLFKTGDLPRSAMLIDGERVRFFIHPHSRPLFERAFASYRWQSEFWATPTSSHRSLIVWNPHTNEAPFGVKTTLDARIGDSLRHLGKDQIQRAAAVSSLLNEIGREKLASSGILFLDEPLSAYTDKASTSYPIGFSIRSLPKGDSIVVPMFSLYSVRNDGSNLLDQMIRQSPMEPRAFVEHYLLEPLIRQFMTLSFEHGLVFEPHEQNLLIEIRDGMPTTRFVYRDLAGFVVNPDLRAKAGKDLRAIPIGIERESLKSAWARPVDNAVSYLWQSNFFALAKVLRAYQPSITKQWIEERFRYLMAREITRFTGSKVDTKIQSWKEASQTSDRVVRSCRGIFN